MEIICTRPSCTNSRNFFGDLDGEAKIRTVQQRYCKTCGMPLILADRYFPDKLLGQGGFGAAFLARDRYKPKLSWCVVKQFQPAANLDAQELAVAQNLFQREAIVLEELGHKHPQIPDLYAFFTPIVSNPQRTGEEQYFYLAQEFINGQDLETELEAKGKFSEAEVEEILTEMLKVLVFVHDNNTIHRDIKPSNIMRNKQGVLYLLDFGSVKQIAAGGGNQRKSTGIYSMGFAPPEQMAGAEVYPSTDLYALAVTCINLLTGEPTEELYDSFNYSWNWRGYAPQTSDRLVTILNKMLQPTPAQRFQSATEVLAALAISKPVNTYPNKSSTNSGKKKSPNSPIVSTITVAPHPPSTPVPTPNVPSSLPKQRNQPSFSLLEVLGSAAFTGFEGGLLYIGLTSALSVSGISLGIFGMTMGGLMFALHRRIIEKVDLLFFIVITTTLVLFVPSLQGTLEIQTILIIAVMSAASAIAITAFFRLVFQLLTRFL
jgi:serine/threonine protein kinase